MRFRFVAALTIVLLMSGLASRVDSAETSSVQPPGVIVTTVGGRTASGTLLHLRFSQFYGTGQCPGLVYDTQKQGDTEFTLLVSGDRRLINVADIKTIRIDWTKADIGDYVEPTFTVTDQKSKQITGRPSWGASTSVSEVSLISNEDGKIIVISAKPDMKADAQNLLSLVEFTGPGTGVGSNTVIELQRQVSGLEERLTAANNELSTAKQELAAAKNELSTAKQELAAADEKLAQTPKVDPDLVARQAKYIEYLLDKYAPNREKSRPTNL